MDCNCGFVRLPRAGKSTIINAIAAAGAEAASCPFRSTEPIVGVAAVPDRRNFPLPRRRRLW